MTICDFITFFYSFIFFVCLFVSLLHVSCTNYFQRYVLDLSSQNCEDNWKESRYLKNKEKKSVKEKSYTSFSIIDSITNHFPPHILIKATPYALPHNFFPLILHQDTTLNALLPGKLTAVVAAADDDNNSIDSTQVKALSVPLVFIVCIIQSAT